MKKQFSMRGCLVKTKNGIKGRIYHFKGLINGKVPVYPEIGNLNYSDKAILCDPNTLKVIGFID